MKFIEEHLEAAPPEGHEEVYLVSIWDRPKGGTKLFEAVVDETMLPVDKVWISLPTETNEETTERSIAPLYRLWAQFHKERGSHGVRMPMQHAGGRVFKTNQEPKVVLKIIRRSDLTA